MNKPRHLHPTALLLTTVFPSGGVTGSEVASQRFIDGLRRCGCGVAHEFLRRARLVVAVPSTRGAGIQIKTLDAIASGSAVATPLALRDIHVPPWCIRVADTASEFAAWIRTLVLDDSCEVDALAWSEAKQARFFDYLAERLAELAVRSPSALARS